MSEIIYKPAIAWPSGMNKAIFMAKAAVDDIAKKHKLPLIFGEDELGEYKGTFFVIQEIGDVAVEERDYPTIGEISVYVDSKVDTETAITLVKDALGIQGESVTWVQAEI